MVTDSEGPRRSARGAGLDWVEEVCRRTDVLLWDGYSFAMGAADASRPTLIFPRKGQEPRVGEQEARLAFVAALLADKASGSFAFAAEVPTRLSYRFAHKDSGLKAQRALTDLAIYHGDGDEPALAVEFKSGGRSGKSVADESVRIDMAKVLAEEPDALWFHVLRSASNTSLQSLLRTLDEAVSLLSNSFRLSGYLARGKAVEARAKTIVFHVCVLDPDVTVSIHRSLDYVPGRPQDDFFTIVTKETRSSLEVAEGQGWSVHRPAHFSPS